MKSAVALAGLLLAGCAKYVPVEIQIDKPVAPGECKRGLAHVGPMKEFTTDPRPTAVQINAAWSRREIERNAMDRRNDRQVEECRIFIKHVAK